MLATTNVIFCGFNTLSNSYSLECSKDYMNLTSTSKPRTKEIVLRNQGKVRNRRRWSLSVRQFCKYVKYSCNVLKVCTWFGACRLEVKLIQNLILWPALDAQSHCTTPFKEKCTLLHCCRDSGNATWRDSTCASQRSQH